MKRFPPIALFKSVEEFRETWTASSPGMDCIVDQESVSKIFNKPVQLTGLGKSVGNRFAIHPMEGWDANRDGSPSELTFRRWRNLGLSGAKLIWGGEAFAVQGDGRANPNQLYNKSRDESIKFLDKLRSSIKSGHDDAGDSVSDLVIGLQLTHSGRFARPHGPRDGKRVFSHPFLEEKYPEDECIPILTDGELEAIGENFVEAAQIAAESGFDFVDIKCCHGYLLHEVLAGHTRPGQYGGSLQNRTRLFRNIVTDIRAACPGLGLGVRLSATDCVPFNSIEDEGIGVPICQDSENAHRYAFGLQPGTFDAPDYDEPVKFIDIADELGIELVNISIGSPYYCPHVQRPAAYPPSDGYVSPEDPLRSVARHIMAVRTCKKAFPHIKFVGSGYSYLQEFLSHVAAYEIQEDMVDFVGIGRMFLSYPEFPRDVLASRPFERKRICRTFSDCTSAPRNGLVSGCYPLDPYYKSRPEALELKKIKKMTAKKP
ncbi:MAG: NADH:flavin oxidoreductase [Candidatus Hydrogenedentota bacterium]|nr:MAG: NADH:flavin oxidoreductase [Candidatus Hydrogenedentota bacterium]